MRFPILKNGDIVITKILPKHNKELFEIFKDPEVKRNTIFLPKPLTKHNLELWINRNNRKILNDNLSNFYLGIYLSNRIVGVIGFHIQGTRNHRAEISYVLHIDHRRNGICTKAVKTMVNFGFYSLRLKRIYGATYKWNTASQKVLEKAGFKFVGILRNQVLKDGKLIDSYQYDIIPRHVK